MTRKTSFLLPFLIFAVASGAAYSADNYATEDYVDEQYIDIVDYVDSKNRTLKNTMTANDNQLYANQEVLRDMLNARDANDNWIELNTEAKLAIPAINELKAALDAKANVDDVLTADSLTELNEAVAALELGKADATDLESLQNALDSLGDTYATDAELTAQINAVKAMIPSMSDYVLRSDLATVATSGQYADLQGKPDIPSIEGLATKDELNAKQNVINADNMLSSDFVSGLAPVATSGQYADLQGKPDIPSIEGLATKDELNAKQNVINADNMLSSDFVSGLATVATTGSYESLTDKPTIPSTENLATKDELNAKQNVINADNMLSSDFVSGLAPVATSGQYADLQGKPDIPSIEGLATEEALSNLQSTLQAAIDEKQAKGEYLVAADLKTLEDAVTALQSGKADASTVTTIQESISKLGDTYATDAELTAAIDAVKLLIPTIPTKVSAFENDAGYITDTALTDYAKSADVEMIANKVSDATAEQIEAMSSADKATKYPSIAVSQTIANAAVTKVNEVAGDLSTLQTQVSTNTADIAELDETVEEVSVVAYAAIPAPTEACKSVSGACALSSDTEGNLTWVMIANSLTDVQ